MTDWIGPAIIQRSFIHTAIYLARSSERRARATYGRTAAVRRARRSKSPHPSLVFAKAPESLSLVLRKRPPGDARRDRRSTTNLSVCRFIDCRVAPPLNRTRDRSRGAT